MVLDAVRVAGYLVTGDSVVILSDVLSGGDFLVDTILLKTL